MFKSILLYILSFGLLFVIGFCAHESILDSTGKTLDFSLLSIYTFHTIFSFGICLLVLILSKLPKLAPQLGFLYLGGFLLKFFTFATVFQGIVLGENALMAIDSVSLLVPIILFVGLEVYFVAKVLRMIDVN